MRVVITGATGTIGTAVSSALRARGDAVVALSRDADRGRQVLGSDAEVHAWPDPHADARARRGAARNGRRRAPAGRAGRAALDRGVETPDPGFTGTGDGVTWSTR